MAQIISNQKNLFRIQFSEMELAPYGVITVSTVKRGPRVFVNWALPLLTWDSHDARCADDILDALKKIGNWQGKLQDRQPKYGGHSHKPTILRDNGLKDQKIRFPVFAKQSEPYVQWVRDTEQGSRWLVHGFTFNDDLPSLGAYFAALTKLKSEWVVMNR